MTGLNVLRLKLLLLMAGFVHGAGAIHAQSTPRSDYHQHLLSPAVATLMGAPQTFTASDLVKEMDAAGVEHSLILSLAYQFGNPHRPPLAKEYTMVRAENDWTAGQVKAYPNRLIGACGVDPLKDYAVAEVKRCSGIPQLRSALKLHFGNSNVDLDNPEHIIKLRAVFRSADENGMAIVVHMHANVDHHRPYGRREAEIFVAQVLPAAPHSYVQIAHLAGSGGFDDTATISALSVFVEAIRRNDPRVSHVYFDISGVAGLGDWKTKKELIASSIRAIGVHRILFGSDGAWTGFTPKKAIAAFDELPLTAEEFRVIDGNNLPSFPWR